MEQTPAVPPARTIRILHAVLTGGAFITSGVFAGLTGVLGVPMVSGLHFVGHIIAGIAVACMIAAVAIVSPKVAERRSGQSLDDYWQAADARGPALTLWFVLEGSGIVACIGYAISGALTSALVAAAAIAMLIWFRPGHFE